MATVDDRYADPAFVIEDRPAKRKKGKLGRKMKPVLMFARRAHLYAGLFMLPWVVLYGVTGALFNHSKLFPDMAVVDVPADRLPESITSQLPSQVDVAAEVVASLNADGGYPDVELIGDGDARYSGELSFNVAGEEESHVVHVNPVTGDAWVATTPEETHDRPADPLGGRASATVETSPVDVAKRAVPAILDEAGLVGIGEPVAGRRGGGSMTFRATVDGQPSTLTYNLSSGQVTAHADSAESDMSARRFALRLHMARGYEPQMSTKWLWALSVDAMAISMVGWGLTGMLMWWQIKRTRFAGGVVLLLSGFLAVYVAAGMHRDMSAAPARGGHGGGGGGGHGGRGAAMMQEADSAPAVDELSDDEFFDALLGDVEESAGAE